MRLTSLTLIAGLLGGAAMADAVNPQDVQFGPDGAVATSLSGMAGDPENGAKVMTSRPKGNCVACHMVTALSKAPFHGDVGPSLDGAATRWTEAQLRGIVANSKLTFEASVMPSFYKGTGYIRPSDDYKGKAATQDPLPPLLSAQEIEDVVAFLVTLKQ